ncbi:MAG: acyltransferase [Candidatus Gracilibacteria bacterium]|nr:acyltransferase [Candidatus Gracilibacteria bacterium]
MPSKERNLSLDLFRTIGLLCIVLAHVNPPDFLFQIRNFDVPFMVIISGYLYANLDMKKPEGNFWPYIYKRFIRLILPVWIFLSIFFTYFWGLAHFTGTIFPFSFREILGSYLLWDGIGYVWIIRIFFIIALIGPLSVKLLNKSRHKYKILIFIYLAYEFIYYFFSKLDINDSEKNIITKSFFYIIPYLLLFFYGRMLSRTKRKGIELIAYISFAIIVAGEIYSYMQTGNIMNIQAYKYPPTFFYLVYAIFMSSMIFIYIEEFKEIKNKKAISTIKFIGSSTMWIYLWHIPAVYYFQHHSTNIYYLWKYLLVLAFAISLTLIQQKIFKQVLKKTWIKDKNKKFIRAVFMG